MISKISVFIFFSIIGASYGYGSYAGVVGLYNIQGHIPETERVPKFLKDADQKVIDSYHQLIKDNWDRTDGELDKLVDKWIAKQTKDIQVQKSIKRD